MSSTDHGVLLGVVTRSRSRGELLEDAKTSHTCIRSPARDVWAPVSDRLVTAQLGLKLVDDLTGTGSNKRRESWALAVANLCAGAYGGIAGCAMIGQTVLDVETGRARTHLSTLVAALVLLLLVTGLHELMAQIPMLALAAVMMVVAVKPVNWDSLRWSSLRRAPLVDTSAMLVTVAITVVTRG